jgi:predicted protein tyrosine phosphatase
VIISQYQHLAAAMTDQPLIRNGPLAATRVLFICSQNRLRSPTAERIFSARAGLEVASAGIAPDAAHPVSGQALEWADLIFVMENWHQSELSRRFGPQISNKRVVCLDIPDVYMYMDPDLVRLLEAKAGPFLLA